MQNDNALNRYKLTLQRDANPTYVYIRNKSKNVLHNKNLLLKLSTESELWTHASAISLYKCI